MKDKNLKVKVIATDDVDSVTKRTESGEFSNYDEVIVGDQNAINRFMEILDELDDDGKPIKK